MDIDVHSGTNVRERTIEAIGFGIVDGAYPPGHRFANQDDLSAELGVSRNVLREALGLLRDKGLIESRPKAGTMVADSNAWALLDPDVLRWSVVARSAHTTLSHLAVVRWLIEPGAARLAALRRSDEAAEEIVRLCEALAESVDDETKRIEADLAFRAAVFRAAANPILAKMAEVISGAVESSRSATVQVSDGPASTINLYRRVAEAIHAGDDIEAARAMSELVEASADDLPGMH